MLGGYSLYGHIQRRGVLSRRCNVYLEAYVSCFQTGRPIWSWPFVKAYIADIHWGKLNDGRYIVAAKEDAIVALLDVAKLGVPALAGDPSHEYSA